MTKRRFVRIIIVLLSISLSIGLLRSLVNALWRRDLVRERQMVLNEEKARNAELLSQLREATSSAFVEKQAREKLGFVKPGDTVVLLGSTTVVGPNHPQSSESRGSVGWRRWWSLFF